MEYILLALVLMIIFHVSTKTLKDSGSLENFQRTPDVILTNLIENGNWKIDPNESRKYHPNDHYLHYTPYGDGI